MNRHPRLPLAASALLATLAAPPAAAQELGAPLGAYAGLALGQLKTTVQAPGAGPGTGERVRAGSLFGGLALGPRWGAELGIHLLGDVPAGTRTDEEGRSSSWVRQTMGITLTGTASLALGRSLTLSGEGGLLYWSASARNNGAGFGQAKVTDAADSGRSGASLLLGAGMTYAVSPSWALRAKWGVASRVLDGRATLWSAGALFRF